MGTNVRFFGEYETVAFKNCLNTQSPLLKRVYSKRDPKEVNIPTLPWTA